MNHTAEKLLTFIKESPTAFQAVEMMKQDLRRMDLQS